MWLEPKRGGGTITITAEQTAFEAARIVVADTGVGIPALFGAQPDEPAAREFYGIGLQNVDARLRQLYERDGLLQLCSSPETGTQATLLIPQQSGPPPLTSTTPALVPSLPETTTEP